MQSSRLDVQIQLNWEVLLTPVEWWRPRFREGPGSRFEYGNFSREATREWAGDIWWIESRLVNADVPRYDSATNQEKIRVSWEHQLDTCHLWNINRWRRRCQHIRTSCGWRQFWGDWPDRTVYRRVPNRTSKSNQGGSSFTLLGGERGWCRWQLPTDWPIKLNRYSRWVSITCVTYSHELDSNTPNIFLGSEKVQSGSTDRIDVQWFNWSSEGKEERVFSHNNW